MNFNLAPVQRIHKKLTPLRRLFCFRITILQIKTLPLRLIKLSKDTFVKSRATIQKAITGYKEINLRGMKLVKPGGFLVTSSCTNLVQPELFLQIIDMAAKDARRRIRQVAFQTQSADHPIHWNMENTHYLKFLIIEIGDKY